MIETLNVYKSITTYCLISDEERLDGFQKLKEKKL